MKKILVASVLAISLFGPALQARYYKLPRWVRSYAIADFLAGQRPLLQGEVAPFVPFGYTQGSSIYANPTNGSVAVQNNEWVYTPNTGFTGTDTFTWQASPPNQYYGYDNVVVYSTASHGICTRTGALNSDGSLKWIPKAQYCTYYSRQNTRLTSSGIQVTMDYLLNYPSTNVTIKGIVVLIPGGNLQNGISGNPSTGVASTANGGNYVMRTAQSYADDGYITVAINAPSDFPSTANTDAYRLSTNHAVDILSIINFLNYDNLPVFLVGTSDGSKSVVAQNRIATGISLSSPVTIGQSGFPSYLYIDESGYPTLAMSSIERPADVMYNTNDLCQYSPPSGSHQIYTELTQYQTEDVVSGGLEVTKAGNGVTPDVCGPFDYHGYLGIEPTATAKTTAWLDSVVSILNNNADIKPKASPATIDTPVGQQVQFDLSTISQIFTGNAIWELDNTTTSLGGTVSINGSVVTYTPPSNAVSGQTDYFVYDVMDELGGVSANYVTVQVQ